MTIKKMIKRWLVSLYVNLAIILFELCHFIPCMLFGKRNRLDSLRFVSKPILISLMSRYHAQIGENCDIETGIVFHNCSDLSKLSIGNDVHIGKNCLIDLRHCVSIGHRCTVSMGTTILTHVDVGKSKLSENYPAMSEPIVIHNDAFIGANSTILMGSEIGERSMVAANSLVRGMINRFSLYAGCPAEHRKKLFD